MSITNQLMCRTAIRIAYPCVLVAIVLSQAWAAPEKSATKSAEDTSTVVREIAELFQDAKEQADGETLKALLRSCAERLDLRSWHDKQSDAFRGTVDEFIDYVNQHHLTATDIEELRLWIGGIRHCSDDEVVLREDTKRVRKLQRVFEYIWESVENERDTYEPRHAVLGSAIDAATMSFPRLTSCARRLRRLREKVPPGNHDDLSTTDRFLIDPQQQRLWKALQSELSDERLARGSTEFFEAERMTQRLLDSQGNATVFRKQLKPLMTLCEKAVKSTPSFGIPERFPHMQRLRAIWNIVHAYGTEADKADFKAFIESLQKHYAAHADSLTVEWLDQVMKAPGKPFEKYFEPLVFEPTAPADGTEKESE